MSKSATRSGVGGASVWGESSLTCRDALNSSTGQTSRTPNAASNAWHNAFNFVDRLTFGGNLINTGTDSYRLASARTQLAAATR